MLTIFKYTLLVFLLRTQVIGQVVYVSDGDTFHVKIKSGEKIRIRLEGIDCPEITQPYGLEAKEFVINNILNKEVRLHIVDTDQYGRKIAKVFFNGKDLAKALLENGYAWHYKRYNQETDMAELENTARTNKVGLWSEPNPVPPWEFRKTR